MALSKETLARIRAEVEEVKQAALQGTKRPPAKRATTTRKKSGPSRRGENLRNRPPAYNREEIIRLYRDEGKRVFEIVAITGAHRATISKILTDVRSDLPAERVCGPKRRDTCSKGHSMENPVLNNRGERSCRTCKQDRDRKSHKKRYWENKQK